MSSVYNSIAFVLLKYFHASNIVQGLMFCYAINTAITWLITRHWKISIHTLSISSSITIFYLIGYNYIFLILILLALAVTARVITNSHTFLQSIVGIAVGIISTYLQLILLFI